jgi:hypothetical protein
MNSALSRFLRKSAVPIVAVLALIVVVPVTRAETAPQLDKHARKIEKHLAKFRPGTYLDFEFRDGSQTFGSLGEMSDASFQFTDADSNKIETHLYSDVASVRKAKEYIGEGSGHGHHVRLLLPVLISAGVVAAGLATYEALR